MTTINSLNKEYTLEWSYKSDTRKVQSNVTQTGKKGIQNSPLSISETNTLVMYKNRSYKIVFSQQAINYFSYLKIHDAPVKTTVCSKGADGKFHGIKFTIDDDLNSGRCTLILGANKVVYKSNPIIIKTLDQESENSDKQNSINPKKRRVSYNDSQLTNNNNEGDNLNDNVPPTILAQEPFETENLRIVFSYAGEQIFDRTLSDNSLEPLFDDISIEPPQLINPLPPIETTHTIAEITSTTPAIFPPPPPIEQHILPPQPSASTTVSAANQNEKGTLSILDFINASTDEKSKTLYKTVINNMELVKEALNLNIDQQATLKDYFEDNSAIDKIVECYNNLTPNQKELIALYTKRII